MRVDDELQLRRSIKQGMEHRALEQQRKSHRSSRRRIMRGILNVLGMLVLFIVVLGTIVIVFTAVGYGFT